MESEKDKPGLGTVNSLAGLYLTILACERRESQLEWRLEADDGVLRVWRGSWAFSSVA